MRDFFYGLSPIPYRGGLRDFSLLNDFMNFDKLEKQTLNFKFGFASDIKENETSYIVEAELPGFEKEDIAVEFEDGILTVSAERKSTDEDKKDGYIRRERFVGKYSRTYSFEGVDGEQIKAKYDKGILVITVPKVQKSVVKKGISVE